MNLTRGPKSKLNKNIKNLEKLTLCEIWTKLKTQRYEKHEKVLKMSWIAIFLKYFECTSQQGFN